MTAKSQPPPLIQRTQRTRLHPALCASALARLCWAAAALGGLWLAVYWALS